MSAKSRIEPVARAENLRAAVRALDDRGGVGPDGDGTERSYCPAQHLPDCHLKPRQFDDCALVQAGPNDLHAVGPAVADVTPEAGGLPPSPERWQKAGHGDREVRRLACVHQPRMSSRMTDLSVYSGCCSYT